MKKINGLAASFFIVIVTLTLVNCKKDKLEEEVTTTPVIQSTITPLTDFYKSNGVPLQEVTIDGTVGGTFTTPQGTTVTIPDNAFVTLSGAPVSGKITIQFKDIYTKSDMLLSNAPSQTESGPLKSAGEFFIVGLQQSDNSPVSIAIGKSVYVQQPAMGKTIDPSMAPFELNPDVLSATNNKIWKPISAPTFTVIPNDTIRFPPQLHPDVYIYGMYQFKTPKKTGSWYNSANPNYFADTTKTNLTIHPNFNASGFYTNVFLVFSDINSTVEVYNNSKKVDFNYSKAPINAKCTVVALATKKDTLYSYFTTITISANQILNFDLTKTTAGAFKTALKALD
jgi:hypothetical protein